MNGNIVETLIGAVVLVVAGAFLYFAFTRVDPGAVDGYELTAQFERIDGIKVGSDVTVGGIKIGTVIGSSLDTKTYMAVVKIAVRDDIKLPTDSSIKVASSGLLGGSYLAIEPGGEDEMLKAGEEIIHTQGSVDLTELLGKAIYSSGNKGNGG